MQKERKKIVVPSADAGLTLLAFGIYAGVLWLMEDKEPQPSDGEVKIGDPVSEIEYLEWRMRALESAEK